MEKRYDPDKNPDRAEWLALDEEQKLHLVQQYHRKNGIRSRNASLHALIHVTVENHVVLGNQVPVNATLLKLMCEGLGRHEAIHTLGIVLWKHVDSANNKANDTEFSASDYLELGQLTAEDFLNSFDEED